VAAASHPFPGFGTDSPLSYDPVVADGTFAGLLGSMDADVNRRGRQFERVVRWWLGNVPVNPFAPHRIEDVWLWDEWPDRPGVAWPRVTGDDLTGEFQVRVETGSLNGQSRASRRQEGMIILSQVVPAVAGLGYDVDGLVRSAPRRMGLDPDEMGVSKPEVQPAGQVAPAATTGAPAAMSNSALMELLGGEPNGAQEQGSALV